MLGISVLLLKIKVSSAVSSMYILAKLGDVLGLQPALTFFWSLMILTHYKGIMCPIGARVEVSFSLTGLLISDDNNLKKMNC